MDEKEYTKAQWQFSQSSGLISVVQENNVFGVICGIVLEDNKVKKGGKCNHPRPLNYQNIKRSIIKFTCTNLRIVSAEKDVVETFTL